MKKDPLVDSLARALKAITPRKRFTRRSLEAIAKRLRDNYEITPHPLTQKMPDGSVAPSAHVMGILRQSLEPFTRHRQFR